jgi:DnaJ domain
MPASCGYYGELTVSDIKDYYSLLGLDREASGASIKLAYRRLARENHPDLVQHLGNEALEQAASLMSAINEAYRVLSNSRLRREYDATLAQGLRVPPLAPSVAEDLEPASTPVAVPARRRARPSSEVMATVVGGFSKRLHQDLMGRPPGFKWSTVQLEGFDWGVSASFWTAQYLVALRGLAVADPESATKFTNYCNVAMARSNHALKRTYYLFFLAFQKTNDAPSVAALLRRFCGNANGQRTPGPACIAFTDAVRAKSLLCGVRPDDSRYQELLNALGLSRSAQG